LRHGAASLALGIETTLAIENYFKRAIPGKRARNMDAASQSLPTEEMLVKELMEAKSRTSLEKLGMRVSRYGLVVTLLLIGALKFTAGEAQGIQPLVASSPLMFWLYRVFSLQAVSNLIGMIEIAVAVLIALRPLSAKLSFIGSIGAIITFLLTVSFLFSTPGAIHFSHGFLLLGDAGQFLIKDVVLLGASIWTAAEARNAQ
jgi:reactive chlorine resistance protein C